MANFVAKQIDLSKINGGVRYNIGDSPTAEAINAPIEASAYAQELAIRASVEASEALDKVNDSAHGEITLSAYPIGSIYISTNNTSPASLFGGVWSPIEDRFLLGASVNHTAGTTGGKDKITLTEKELPSHSHYVKMQNEDTPLYTKDGIVQAQVTGNWHRGITSNGTDVDGLAVTNSVGDGEPYDNMPPYLSVYMWERIS